MFRERGGSSTFARHAFNELIAFIAGWAILIDYLIVIALAAISVPHYLEPISGEPRRAGLGDRRRRRWSSSPPACSTSSTSPAAGRQRSLAAARPRRHRPAAGGDRRRRARRLPPRPPHRPARPLHRPRASRTSSTRAVVAMLAYAGIEAASDLAPDIDVEPPRPEADRLARRVRGAARLRRDGGDRADGGAGRRRARTGPTPRSAASSSRTPVLGVVSAYHPAWVADTMRWMVALVAAPVLFWAANTSMLGVSRHIYTLAINRQIPSWLGKLEQAPRDPLRGDRDLRRDRDRPGRADQRQAAGRHLRLRRDAGDHDRPPLDHPAAGHRARSPAARSGSRWSVRWRGAELPVPAIFAALLSGLAFLSVLAYHDTARWVGGGWMAFGLALLRRLPQGLRGDDADQAGLGHRAGADQAGAGGRLPQHPRPVFGTKLDDDIVATAGRLAAAEQEEAGGEADDSRLDLVYVIEVPLTLPLDAELPPEREEEARRALERAREVGEEYEDVEVSTEVVRAREVGAGIVEAARRSGAEAIVIGGEPPTKIRGGAVLGGIGAAKPAEIGAGDRVRAEEGALPGPAHRAAGDARRAGGRARPPPTSIRRHVHPDRRLRPRRLLGRPGDAARGPRGLLPRRGPRVPRAARGRPREGLGGPRRPVHGRRRPRDRRAGRRRDRAAPTPSSPPPTATTPTSSSPRSPSAATRCRP